MSWTTTTPRRPNGAPLDLAVIRGKCTADGECWTWDGAMHHGMPVVRHGRQVVNVRRHIAAHIQLQRVAGLLASTLCHNPACCAPDHIRMLTRRQLQKRTARRVGPQQGALRNARLSILARRRSVLDAASVALIRGSDRTGRDLAQELGVSLSCVQKVRRFETWRDFANPFSGLMR